jgi:hypothetical protein
MMHEQPYVSFLTMGVMFILDLIRKEEIVVDLEAFVEG